VRAIQFGTSSQWLYSGVVSGDEKPALIVYDPLSTISVRFWGDIVVVVLVFFLQWLAMVMVSGVGVLWSSGY
jgi:hypothetical protein